MNRRPVFWMILMLLLVSISCVTLRVQRVEASGTVYIRVDGRIDPPTAPISTVDNVTYILTGNITSDADGIVVERDSIVVDGAGYAVQGPGSIVDSIGIELTGTNITLTNATISQFRYGVWVRFGYSYNNIAANNIVGNNWGIDLEGYCSNNSITANNITNSFDFGIRLWDSSNYNSIAENYITNNGRGFLLSGSSNNSIFHNDIVNNTQQVQFFAPSYANAWDDGYPSGGNCWSDYNGTDSNHYGIGDTPYIIDANNTDNYPLMGIFSEFVWISLASPEQRIQTVCNSTISDPVYNGISIRFNVTGESGTAGFCRICIPMEFMNNTLTVYVNGTETPYTIVYSNSTHNYLYFNYTHSTHEVVIVPEFPSFITLQLFMMATLLTVVVHRRKHST